jgi:hypothetical protein
LQFNCASGTGNCRGTTYTFVSAIISTTNASLVVTCHVNASQNPWCGGGTFAWSGGGTIPNTSDAHGAAPTSSPMSVNVTASSANSLIIGLGDSSAVNPSAGTGYTAFGTLVNTGVVRNVLEYALAPPSGAGTNAVTETTTGTTRVIVGLAFDAPSGAVAIRRRWYGQ